MAGILPGLPDELASACQAQTGSGHHRIRIMAGVMNANGIKRKLARKVGRAVAMSTAVYGIEAIWEGQSWLFDGFHRLSTAIGRTAAGTFSTTKGEDAIRAADISPTRPTWTGDENDSSLQHSPPPPEHQRSFCSFPRLQTTLADTGSRSGSPRLLIGTGSSRKAGRSRQPPHAGGGGSPGPDPERTRRRGAATPGQMDPFGRRPVWAGSSQRKTGVSPPPPPPPSPREHATSADNRLPSMRRLRLGVETLISYLHEHSTDLTS
jgi:hypothetical protein